MLYKEKINEVINNGETVRIEYSIETIKGKKWFQSSISLVRNTGQTVVVSARDITERKEMEKSIISAKEEAEKASRAKSQFLSSMSHELRTPLNAILGFSQILEMDPEAPLNESQSQSVNEILKAGNHLLTLINEVLDLSKVESGKMSISIKPVEIKKVVDEAIALVIPMAQKHNVEIDISNVEYMNEYVLADNTRLKQVLINLLSNAVKYNKENGKVTLYCDKGDKFIRFNVVDTGKGISKDDIELVFKAFYRVDDRTSTVEGTGIGLAVAKEIVELMGGNINVESKEGVGSRFYIELPYNWESEAQ
jgi:signal transduction histidine kinase